MDNDIPLNQQYLLWKVFYGDVVMYFEDEGRATHNFEAFKRAGLNPTMQEYRLVSTISA